MNEEAPIENQSDQTDEPASPEPSKPVAPVKKDLPKKKWRKQGLRKSTRSR